MTFSGIYKIDFIFRNGRTSIERSILWLHLISRVFAKNLEIFFGILLLPSYHQYIANSGLN